MFDKIFSLLGLQDNIEPQESIDTKKIVQEIRSEEKRDIPTGKRIYMIDYLQYNLVLDREFTGRYRISVFVGNHKVYGFTITEEEITNEQFITIWDKIITFLNGDPLPQNLPDHKLLESHFFGNP